MEEHLESQETLGSEEDIIMNFYYDQDSPSGVGFETIDILAQNKETLCLAMDLATKISDSLPEEAKEIMTKEHVPLYRIFTDQKGFWGEWCDTKELKVELEMDSLLDKIAADLERATQ